MFLHSRVVSLFGLRLTSQLFTLYKCRPLTLEHLCQEYICRFCDGAGVKDAELRGADIANVLSALAQALQVTILVQAKNDLYPREPMDHVPDQQNSRAPWHRHIGLLGKEGHYAVAW